MVMFRDFAARKAKSLGVIGWVRNEEDGSVHVVAEGEEAALGELLSHLNKGPLFAKVKEVKVEWKDATGEFSNFKITY